MARSVSRRRLVALAAAGAAGVVLGKRFFGGAGEHISKLAPTLDMGAAGGGGGAGGGPELVDAGKLSQSFRALGRYIYLTPEKLGGGTHAVDLSSGKTLASIAYWNYGDTCPISHHLAAYPSPDPYKGFEFVNSTQGADNVLIYVCRPRLSNAASSIVTARAITSTGCNTTASR